MFVPEEFLLSAKIKTVFFFNLRASAGAVCVRYASELPRARGVICLRLSVAADGTVEKVKWLADSLVPSPGNELPSPTEIRDAIMLEVAGTMMDTSFPPAGGPSEITLPFMFD